MEEEVLVLVLNVFEIYPDEYLRIPSLYFFLYFLYFHVLFFEKVTLAERVLGLGPSC